MKKLDPQVVKMFGRMEPQEFEELLRKLRHLYVDARRKYLNDSMLALANPPPASIPSQWSMLDLAKKLWIPVDRLELSVRSANCLCSAPHIRYVGDLVQHSKADLLKIKNLGTKSLREIEMILIEDFGLRFGMIKEDWASQYPLPRQDSPKEEDNEHGPFQDVRVGADPEAPQVGSDPDRTAGS